MVKYAWIFGRVIVLVEYFEQIGPDEIEGGARVEVRRLEKELVPGATAAVSGFRVLPVSDGIWRADLFHLLNRPGHHPIYHYHPKFTDGDVGEREFDPGLTADHIGWSLAQVSDLKGLLAGAGFAALAADIDDEDLRAVLPQIKAGLEYCDAGRRRWGRRLLTPDGEARARAERLADPV